MPAGIDVERTDFGLRIFALRELGQGSTHIRVTNLVFPQAFVIPLSSEMTITQWHVPVDDQNCYWYAIFTSFGEPVNKPEMRSQRLELYELPDYTPRLNRGNDYGYDPAEQQSRTYTGMGFDINVHDQWAVELQGAIHERTREYLASSDIAIVAYRRLLLRAIQQAERGERPPMMLDEGEARHMRGPAAIDGIGPSEAWAIGATPIGGAARVPPWQPTDRRRDRLRRAPRPLVRRAAQRHSRDRAAAETLGVVRLSFPDQHGILRGKTIVAAELAGALCSGYTAASSLLAKDTSHRTVFPVFTRGGGFDMPEMEGAADLLLVPDPLSFKILPWAPHSGWLLCDIYFADGRPVPFGTRQLCRRVLDELNRRGFDYIAGIEVECHIFKLEQLHLAATDAGQPGVSPDVSLLTTGYQLLMETRYDVYDEVLEILRRPIEALGLPLRSLEVEFGPS